MNTIFPFTKKKHFLLTSAIVSAMHAAPYAMAQGNEEASRSSALEEVVVTARKRSQSVMDVAGSIDAVSQQKIEDSGYTDLESYFRTVPGVNLVDGGAQRRVVILRGIATDGDIRAPSLTSVYVDDTLVNSGAYGLDPRIFDLERVEVLKGPQGTLYGGGSMAGSLRYITNKADPNKFEGNVAADLSSTSKSGGGSHAIDAAVNIPLIEDTLGLRIVGYTSEKSGYYKSNYFGTDERGTTDQDGARVSLRWIAHDDVTVTAGYMFDDTAQDGAFESFGPNWRAFNQDSRSENVLTKDAEILSLNVDWDTEWGVLTSATARQNNETYRKQDVSTRTVIADFPDTQIRLAILDDSYEKLISEELRFVSDPDKFGDFEFTVGYFYMDRESHTDVGDYFGVGDNFVIAGAGEAFERMHPGQQWVSTFPVGFMSPFGLTETPGTRPDYLYREIVYSNQTEHSFFGELSYNITETLKATVGIRRSETETDSGFVNQFADFSADDPAAIGTENVVTAPFKEPHTNYKYDLSWRPNDDLLVYGQAAQGFRVGTGSQPPTIQPTCQDIANQRLGGPPAAVKSDTMWGYELGTKATLADGRVQVNAAVFQNDWTDIQVEVFLGGSATCNIGITQNAASATGKGAEFDVIWAATDALHLSMAGSYVDFTIDENQPSLGAQAGDRLPNHPDYQFSVSADYEKELAAGWTGFARTEISYVGDILGSFRSPADGPRATAGDYTLTNLRVGARKGVWDIGLYVNNVFDEVGKLHQNFGRAGLATLVTRPRTLGLNVRTRF